MLTIFLQLHSLTSNLPMRRCGIPDSVEVERREIGTSRWAHHGQSHLFLKYLIFRRRMSRRNVKELRIYK